SRNRRCAHAPDSHISFLLMASCVGPVSVVFLCFPHGDPRRMREIASRMPQRRRIMADGWQTEPTPDLKQLTERAVAARAEVARAFPRQERNMRIAGKESPSGSQLRSSRLRWRVGRASLSALCIGVLAFLVIAPGAQAKILGQWTQADVDHSIQIGVAYIDSKQNPNCSFGTSSTPIAETGMALVAYNVLAHGDINNLAQYNPNYKGHVLCAISWLLNNQDLTNGWWGDGGVYKTNGTGIALGGLGWLRNMPGVDPRLPAAIDNGRNYLINKDFNGTYRTSCSLSYPGTWWCGGWTYNDSLFPSE